MACISRTDRSCNRRNLDKVKQNLSVVQLKVGWQTGFVRFDLTWVLVIC